MMRNIVTGVVVCSMIAGGLALFGCSSDEGQKPSSDEGQLQEAAQQEAVQTEYPVTIDACAVTSDYQGNPAIVVTYTWTNNSSDPQMFEVAIDDKAFQNGVELSFATISVADQTYDMQASFKEVQPGATQTVYQAFLLDDQSDVTVQCQELISFSDEILAEASFSVA